MVTEKTKMYTTLAAICFIICGIHTIYSFFHHFYRFNILSAILYLICVFGSAILLLKKEKNIKLIVAASFLVVYNMYYYFRYFELGDFFSLAGGILFVGLIAINVVPKLCEYSPIAKKYWFVPTAIILLGGIIKYFTYASIDYFFGIYNILAIEIMPCLNCIAIFFVSLLMKETMPAYEVKAKINKSDLFGGADKLKIYKELLDSGAITQDEFDEKKRQALKL